MTLYTLRDLIKIYNGRDHKHLNDGEIPVYGSGGVMRYVDQALCEGDCILLPRVGSLDNIMLVHGSFWTVNTMFYATVNTELADPYYLYEYLKLLNLSKLNAGSAVPRMALSVYYAIPIDLPSIEEQRVIGALIASLKLYINNLEKQIAELEQTAQDLYDYWFVQYDFPDENGNPYRSSGGKMLWNEELKREIPAGWVVENLYSLALFTNGLACQKHRPKDSDYGLPVVKIREMNRGISVNTERVSSNIAEKYRISLGDILFSWSATLLVQRWGGDKAGLNQHIFKVAPHDRVGEGYLFLLLQQIVYEFDFIAKSRKTTMGHITQDHLRTKLVAVPKKEVISEFEDFYHPIRKKWKTLKLQLREIDIVRSEMLPLLLNGQATLGD